MNKGPTFRGDFEAALIQMIRNLVEEKPHKDILAEWDHMRGTDWFTKTQRGISGAERRFNTVQASHADQ